MHQFASVWVETWIFTIPQQACVSQELGVSGTMPRIVLSVVTDVFLTAVDCELVLWIGRQWYNLLWAWEFHILHDLTRSWLGMHLAGCIKFCLVTSLEFMVKHVSFRSDVVIWYRGTQKLERSHYRYIWDFCKYIIAFSMRCVNKSCFVYSLTVASAFVLCKTMNSTIYVSISILHTDLVF